MLRLTPLFTLMISYGIALFPYDALSQVDIDQSVYKGMEFRSIGPFRGGRSAAVTGVVGQPMTYYFGSTGGGVWKSRDGGQSWKNVSDGFFGGSIGAVAVSAWDPNVVYVGGGEKTVRGNVSHGYGMWRSTDAGKNWRQIGLEDSRHISRIRIHPRDPDLVYAAVMGHLFGPNEERGIYRSRDGGETWERIHFISPEVGAVDIAMDPTNPRILFASMWRILRTPYSLESGGDGSGIWKSTDGGDSWTEITRNKGLPSGTIGINCVTVSPVNPERVWAIIEAEDGGVFRSDDGGDTWLRINEDRNLRQRAWYYTRIYADTQNADVVYVLNVGMWRSKDGGKTYDRITTPHGDHHDLWIDPQNSDRMVVGDDGGAQVSYDAGGGWSTYHNQPTAQFYRVTTDNHFPYRIYGAQQDNSTVRILHRSDAGSINERHWEPTAGGESGHIAPDPIDPDIVYGGSYGGFLTRINHKTGEVRSINVWPDNPMGYGAADLKFRFQWNYPIFFSPHDSRVLYTTAQHVFKTVNEGQSWEQISPDLTRNDKSTMGPSGGPITKDNTSIEYYGTVFSALESPHEEGVIWAGSDDGLIHVTRDGGTTWTN
ncbi:MAG: glycosyl hydrolase, partial [Candidatus Latescibacteria bacterium]|nr:glycosyl hydrolase [Candidatus Latescibacterota bacterium]